MMNAQLRIEHGKLTLVECIFSKPQEFSKCVREALVRTPKPLSEQEMYMLSWEAATNRLLEAAAVNEKSTPLVSRAMDSLLAGVHNIASSNEVRSLH